MRTLTTLASLVLLTAAAPPQRWTLEEKVDPITDARSVSLTLRQEPAVMLIQCDASDAQPFSVTVGTTHSYLGGRPILRPTTVRFDAQPPTQNLWGYSGYYSVAQENQKDIIRGISSAKKVAIRLQDGRGAHVDLVFDVTGSAVQVGKFFAACSKHGIS